MSKVIDSLVQASLEGNNFGGVVLAQLHFDPIQRYSSAYQSIYWDEGAGEQEYLGLGHLASMSTLTETNDLSAQTVQLSLSGIPNDTITDIFSDEYIGKPAYIWYATLDTDTYAVQGGQGGPILIFAGRMDYGNVEFGETATITVNITSRLADWERPRGGRFNQAYQQRHVDPTDDGFRYIQAIQNKQISWGSYTLSDPYGTGGISSGRGGACFIANTKITLEDGTFKNIKDVKEGDILFKGNKVLSSIERNYEGNLYSINGSEYFVTDSHPFKTTNGWAAFDVETAKELNPELDIIELNMGSEIFKQDGTIEVITEIKTKELNTLVYNIHVDGENDYFANGYWVHNKRQIEPRE